MMYNAMPDHLDDFWIKNIKGNNSIMVCAIWLKITRCLPLLIISMHAKYKIISIKVVWVIARHRNMETIHYLDDFWKKKVKIYIRGNNSIMVNAIWLKINRCLFLLIVNMHAKYKIISIKVVWVIARHRNMEKLCTIWMTFGKKG